MALVNCSECSNQVSEQAASCPQCGHPLTNAAPANVGELAVKQNWAPPPAPVQTFPPPSAPPHGDPTPQAAAVWTWAPPSAARSTVPFDLNVDPSYRDKFARFDQNGGKFVATWNWPAFFFGAIWYLVKGMWGKALLIFAVAIFSAGYLAIPLWIYVAVAANYDYYLLKRQDKQFW